ncbi:CHAT domain-containing protein [Armillaria mellea]|nr:CHAT domain-containing protein [Armillaria mellea]
MNGQSGPNLPFHNLIASLALLKHYGIQLLEHFQQFGHEDDLQNAISALDHAALFTLDCDPNKPRILTNLCGALTCRFELLKDSRDLDQELITEMKKTLDLIPEGFPERFRVLQNLCNSLLSCFCQFGEPADLDEAIIKGTDALNAVPTSSSSKLKGLVTISDCLCNCFQLNGDFNDLMKAISLLNTALSYIPDGHIYKPTMLKDLGSCHRLRFLKMKDASDLDEAVSTAQRAIAYHKHLNDLKESITCGKKSLSYVPDDDPFKAFVQCCLSNSLALCFFHSKNPSDCEEAMFLCKSAALTQTGQPRNRLVGAVKWARLSRKVDFSSVLETYKVTLDLLPRVAWTGQSIAAQHRRIAEDGFIVNMAVKWAIHCDKADTALEWLEMGQAIVWGQLHNLCSPVDFLSDAHLDLARKLSQVGNALEKATSQDVDTENFKELTMGERAKEHCHLATEWDNLVETAWAHPGFEDFLGPKRLTTLKNAAKLSPVVLFNINPLRCDALILISSLDNVMHIPLQDFSYNRAEILQKQLNKSLSALALQPVHGCSDKDVFMIVLKELWICIVKPVLDSLAFSPCDMTTPPQLWWCPTGPLAFLPIHTVGDYHINEPGTQISDYVISSYIPMVTILLDKLEKTRTFKGLLAISQPNTPGLSSLPGTKGELQKIEEQANGVFVKCLRGEEVTLDKVLDGMSRCNWVHMAWHAMQKKASPLESTFHLHPTNHVHAPTNQGHLPLSWVISKSFPDADFAYLSACQTTTGDEALSEESVHLAAGMLMAGYQSVIATLWSIRDVDVPLIADEVYS